MYRFKIYFTTVSQNKTKYIVYMTVNEKKGNQNKTFGGENTKNTTACRHLFYNINYVRFSGLVLTN